MSAIESLHRVRHRVSQEVGYALRYNRNDDEQAWWVKWPDGHANWYAPEALEFLDSPTARGKRRGG